MRAEQSNSQNQSELDKICTSLNIAFTNTPEASSSQKNTEFQTPQQQILSTKEIIETLEIISQETKIIPTYPTNEIILKVNDIPPLYVLYSPLHKAVVIK